MDGGGDAQINKIAPSKRDKSLERTRSLGGPGQKDDGKTAKTKMATVKRTATKTATVKMVTKGYSKKKTTLTATAKMAPVKKATVKRTGTKTATVKMATKGYSQKKYDYNKNKQKNGDQNGNGQNGDKGLQSKGRRP